MEKSAAELEFESVCNKMRSDILSIEKATRQLISDRIMQVLNKPSEGFEICEAKANLTLAFRHLEDARMRLGKAIQYATSNGISCYDQPMLTK